ncbi:hypothetical protein MYX06_02020 [Patescibacteria group bacterium AH-259-L05]|nr:hypothetical protein [Patescibacteria group bacterium AH-259-L05]
MAQTESREDRDVHMQKIMKRLQNYKERRNGDAVNELQNHAAEDIDFLLKELVKLERKLFL